MADLADDARRQRARRIGAAAIPVRRAMALRQARLKLLIAYSTLAQIGYLFLVFPLAAGAIAWSALGWSAGVITGSCARIRKGRHVAFRRDLSRRRWAMTGSPD